MQTQPITTETSIEIPAPCEDCGPEVLSLDQFKEWSDHDLLAAILVEMIMVRKNFTDISEGLEAMSGSGIGKLFGGLFGG